ncbi:MAG: hypothetical protein RI564_12505, partial [Gracilimonas sp.]|nr:hypothetical protein [Gracilimonas sp.]
ISMWHRIVAPSYGLFISGTTTACTGFSFRSYVFWLSNTAILISPFDSGIDSTVKVNVDVGLFNSNSG